MPEASGFMASPNGIYGEAVVSGEGMMEIIKRNVGWLFKFGHQARLCHFNNFEISDWLS